MGALAVVVLHADAHPPGTYRAAEADHLGGAIAARQMVGEVGGGMLFVEAADLHRPSSALVERNGALEHFKSHRGGARLPHVYLFGGSHRQVNDAAFNER